MNPGRTPPQPIPSWKWGIIWLLFLATMINYMDRQTMQVTSSHLIREFFDGKERGYGQVESAFQYAFAIGMIIARFLVDRFNVRWFYAGALFVWSAAGLCTGLVSSLEALIVCRVVLGLAESFNWPCAVTVVRRVLPLEARSLANGIFHSGASFGAAATPILATLMIGPGGEHWRRIFIVVGAAGGVWLLLWLAFLRGERAHEIEHAEVPAITRWKCHDASNTSSTPHINIRGLGPAHGGSQPWRRAASGQSPEDGSARRVRWRDCRAVVAGEAPNHGQPRKTRTVVRRRFVRDEPQ